jgi:hypothetical protein
MNANRNQRPHEPLAFNREMVEQARRIAAGDDSPQVEQGRSEPGGRLGERPGGEPASRAAGAAGAAGSSARPRCQRPDCPVLEDQARIQDLSENLARAMRKLRRDLAACSRCPAYETCPILVEINAAIQNAIQEVNDEWNLTGD